MRDGVLTKVKPQLLKPYLMRRDDYSSAGIEKIASISVFGHWIGVWARLTNNDSFRANCLDKAYKLLIHAILSDVAFWN